MSSQCPHYQFHGQPFCNDSQDTDGEVQPDVAQGMVDPFCLVQKQTKTLAVLLHVSPDFRIAPVKSGFNTVRLTLRFTGICSELNLG